MAKCRRCMSSSQSTARQMFRQTHTPRDIASRTHCATTASRCVLSDKRCASDSTLFHKSTRRRRHNRPEASRKSKIHISTATADPRVRALRYYTILCVSGRERNRFRFYLFLTDRQDLTTWTLDSS